LSDKDAALLAKLALDGPQARSKVCDLLWPNAGARQVALNLRQRASRLNRASEIRFIDIGDGVRLGPMVSVDALRPDLLATEALLAAGMLLAGVDLGGHDDLDRWLAQARERVNEDIAKVLADRAEVFEQQGRLRDALPLARRVVDLVPLAEHGWRRLMRLHYRRNDRAAAQDAYWKLTTLLRDELGIRPSAETLQLMQTVEAAGPAEPLPKRPVPVSVFRPPVLVGRSQAWQDMAMAWQRPQPFLLVGEAGLGKSRLLEEFVQSREGVVFDRAQPGDERSPYEFMGRLLVQINERFAPGLSDKTRSELARLRPEFGAAPDQPAHPSVLLHAIEQLLIASLGLGLRALVLDDLHCSDEATLDALRRLSARPALAALRLGLASRPTPAIGFDATLAAWLQDSHRPARVELQALTQQELSTLLASLALPSMLDASLAAQLFRHAGGHPLYTLLTLQDALSKGEDFPCAQLPRPSSVQALLDARLSGLPAQAQDLVRVAAVAGADLSVDRVARLLGCSVLALSGTWAVLEAANVLRGESFSHDLVHESALRSVPLGVRQSLHRQLAAILAEDPAYSAARVAWHWEQSERWLDAGRCWHAAGDAARRAGRLAEQTELLERSARCHERSGDAGARFEALHARLDALQLRQGGGAVLVALPDVEALADTSLRRLRCRLARGEAWLDREDAHLAIGAAEVAVREAALHPALFADALTLQAKALVQCAQFEPALVAATRALDAAETAHDPLQKMRTLDALSYVHYATGRLADAVSWQQQVVALAESLGYRVEAITAEGHVAALLATIGDMPGTYQHALRTRERHREIGLAENSTLGAVNNIVLGSAAVALGRFDEGLEALQAAVATAGAQAAPAVRAKSRIALANLWLLLGRADPARALMDTLPEVLGPAMQMQSELVRARAAAIDGLSPLRHLEALGRLATAHADLPLAQSGDFEASYSGEAMAVVQRLRHVREQCESLGLHGTARALQWRELVRWLDLPGSEATEAALQHARQLQAFADTGMSVKCYPPQIWLTLARAYSRAADPAREAECLAAARRWLSAALPHVPADHRTSFMQRNPVNRALLNGDAAAIGLP
jgi:DNA-binding SARP family transcriptional activator